MNDNKIQGSATSQALATAGMELAAANADAQAPGRSERALTHVISFAMQTHEFLGEDVRSWAHRDMGLDHPPKACAWGAVMTRAAREGIIEHAGYAKTRIPPQHSKPAVKWRSLVLREAA